MEICSGSGRRYGITLLVLATLLFSLVPANALAAGTTSGSDKTLRPFPQHMKYTTGSIKPNHVTQEQMDKEVKLLYDQYKKKYIKANPYDKSQYYVWYNDGGWNGDAITVSEAHGYGMMITALMAGHDKEAKDLFDGMYRYFRAHPSALHPDLMAWQQADRDGAIYNVNGTDSAIDGDMDIAYSLLLADKQWGSAGKINYRAEAIKVIRAILESEVHPDHFHLQLGDWVPGSKGGPDFKNATRPSDFMLQHMKEFYKATGDERWLKVIEKTYGIVNSVVSTYSPSTGLLPDFLYLDEKDGTYKPVSEFTWNTESGYFLESEFDGAYNYNSCRTPWRIGTDFLLTGDKGALKQLTTLNQFVTSKHDEPGQIWSGYSLDGKTKLSEWDGGLDFTAPMMVSAMVDSSNQQWLNDLWDYHTDAVNPTEVEWSYYYGNSIRLLSMIVVSGNWWSPTGVASADIAGHEAEKVIVDSLLKGTFNGYPNGKFKPDEAISRAEFAVALDQWLGLEAAGEFELPYLDAATIQPWALPAVSRLVQAGILGNESESDSFKPKEQISRGEVTVLLAKAKKLTSVDDVEAGVDEAASITRAEVAVLLASKSDAP
ncbi:S-layer homology domain-containing protein [Paenibacillus sp. Marseille-P2973]|uniref:glycosyl hydrolase family 8 n=1 Tax=Paenibacillus sp. Marseille-P2973 TaxID=1871032 RepID=UPI001B3711C8|nr:glycosyl hydrolase family 8 [Paenibacillus sp. Marseille-P2973]MBQ4900287.1 S-layer homology domain-containing protein [Paenibacillus sp. Marseille-P2973]